MLYTQEFSSLTAITRFIEANPRTEEANIGSSNEDYEPDMDWDLEIGFDGATEMASKGGYWEEGAKDIMDCHTEMAALKTEGKVPAEDYEVVGHTLDIGAYLGGAPDCYLNEGEEDDQRMPIISIGVQCGRQGSLKSHHIMRRGSAILSVIDDLEDQGYRVELWALWNQNSHGTMTNFRTLIKDAADTWSPSAVAFSLCHPAFNRRLMWRVAEATSGCEPLTHSGYGRGTDAFEQHNRDFDVFLPWQTEKYRWPSAALKDIQHKVKVQLDRKARKEK